MRTVPRAVPPVRGASRGRAAYPAHPISRADQRANRDDLGCVTWLIGSAILLGIVGIVVLAFQLGPGAFSAATDPTPTEQSAFATATIVVEPTATATQPPAPTPTTGGPPTATATTPPQPTATATIPAGTVPSLTNLTLVQAQGMVGDNWPITVVEEFSSSISEGVVIRQDPPSGTTWPLGQPVTVVVSLGEQIVAIPDVRGETVDDASAVLIDLGFAVDSYEEASDTVPAGLVIRSEPVTEAPAGSTVTLVVSSGPSDLVEVPYVYGDDVDEAVETLEDAGLTVARVTALSCERILEFDVDFDCDQFPDEGVVTSTLHWNSMVPRGTAIEITYYDDDL
jgi:serine/threonine-protein kinase